MMRHALSEMSHLFITFVGRWLAGSERRKVRRAVDTLLGTHLTSPKARTTVLHAAHQLIEALDRDAQHEHEMFSDAFVAGPPPPPATTPQ